MTARVPSIDISPFLSADAGGRATVAGSVAKACEEIGFFKISDHGVALDLVIEPRQRLAAARFPIRRLQPCTPRRACRATSAQCLVQIRD